MKIEPWWPKYLQTLLTVSFHHRNRRSYSNHSRPWDPQRIFPDGWSFWSVSFSQWMNAPWLSDRSWSAWRVWCVFCFVALESEQRFCACSEMFYLLSIHPALWQKFESISNILLLRTIFNIQINRSIFPYFSIYIYPPKWEFTFIIDIRNIHIKCVFITLPSLTPFQPIWR